MWTLLAYRREAKDGVTRITTSKKTCQSDWQKKGLTGD